MRTIILRSARHDQQACRAPSLVRPSSARQVPGKQHTQVVFPAQQLYLQMLSYSIVQVITTHVVSIGATKCPTPARLGHRADLGTVEMRGCGQRSPSDTSSGGQVCHRLSQAGNCQISACCNHGCRPARDPTRAGLTPTVKPQLANTNGSNALPAGTLAVWQIRCARSWWAGTRRSACCKRHLPRQMMARAAWCSSPASRASASPAWPARWPARPGPRGAVVTGRAVPASASTPYRPLTEALLQALRDRAFPDDADLAPWLPALRGRSSRPWRRMARPVTRPRCGARRCCSCCGGWPGPAR